MATGKKKSINTLWQTSTNANKDVKPKENTQYMDGTKRLKKTNMPKSPRPKYQKTETKKSERKALP